MQEITQGSRRPETPSPEIWGPAVSTFTTTGPQYPQTQKTTLRMCPVTREDAAGRYVSSQMRHRFLLFPKLPPGPREPQSFAERHPALAPRAGGVSWLRSPSQQPSSLSQ